MNVPSAAPPPLVVDLFAGPGGWDTGLAMLGQELRIVGLEWDRWACRTGHAAGHVRVQADVAHFDPSGMRGAHLLLGSPPCQAWSRSGKRKGILDQPAIFAHAMRVIAAGEWIDYTDVGPLPAGAGDEGGTWHDARSPLVLEVIRWVMAVQPANICLEQVPDVLPFWDLIARWLRGQGYNVWAGCLSSERYGVPQTRERAIVIASRERAVSAPTATHTAYDSRLSDGGKWHGTDGDLFGEGLEPWTSMAEALGWGFDTQPSPTVTAGGTESGGAEVFGNAATRRRLKETVVRTGNNSMVTSRTGSKAGDGGVQPYERPIEHPAPTVDTGAGSKWTIKTHNTTGTGYTGEGRVHYRRAMDHPAPTVDSRADLWEVAPRHSWTHQRPSTTVQGDPRIAQPGHRDREGGERQFAGESVRVTVQEAAILQSFPASGYFRMEVNEMTRDEFCAALLAAGWITVDPENGKVYRHRGPGGVTLNEPAEVKGSNCNGYLVGSFKVGDERKQVKLHRLIWTAVHGVIPDNLTVDHINTDKHDNRIANLRLLTASDNSRAAHEAGLCNKPRSVPSDDHETIAFLNVVMGVTQQRLADHYGVTRGRIGQIIRETGYPWQGTKSAQFRQCGDAVPPRLAAAVIGTCLGLDWQSAVAAHYAGDVAA